MADFVSYILIDQFRELAKKIFDNVNENEPISVEGVQAKPAARTGSFDHMVIDKISQKSATGVHCAA